MCKGRCLVMGCILLLQRGGCDDQENAAEHRSWSRRVVRNKFDHPVLWRRGIHSPYTFISSHPSFKFVPNPLNVSTSLRPFFNIGAGEPLLVSHQDRRDGFLHFAHPAQMITTSAITLLYLLSIFGWGQLVCALLSRGERDF